MGRMTSVTPPPRKGQILRLTIDGDRVRTRVVADGLEFPRGIAVIGDTLYVAELGDMPCAETAFRAARGPRSARPSPRVSDASSRRATGRVSPIPIVADALGEPEVVVDGLHFVNSDHGLNDLDAGPGRAALPVGRQPGHASPGTTAPRRPAGKRRSCWDRSCASTRRPAMSRRSRAAFATSTASTSMRRASCGAWTTTAEAAGALRLEELVRIEEGMDYGFPEDGSVGPYTRRTGFATWIMPAAGSAGIRRRGRDRDQRFVRARDAGATRR